MQLVHTLLIKLYLNIIGFWKSCQEQIWDRHKELSDLPAGEGKTIVITGGNRGIGWEAVKTFLQLGYHVIIGCRRPDALESILQSMEETGNSVKGSYQCLTLDLTSLASVKKFAEIIRADKKPIHVLINNAGIMFGPRKETVDGFEQQMAVNYIGHFLLTHLLMPQLKATGTAKFKSRIVNVSSCAHYVGSWMDLDDIQSKNYYSPESAYGNSKASQIAFTLHLNSILASDDTCHVKINCLHPGVVDTGLYEHAGYVKLINAITCNFLMKTARQGGDTVVYGAISPEIEGKGGLYLDRKSVV